MENEERGGEGERRVREGRGIVKNVDGEFESERE